MLEVDVLDDPEVAITALDPVRSRLLAALTEPASAASLAQRVGLSRQKVNYHLRALRSRGLVTEVGTRRWGGLDERLLVATASSYVVSPAAFGELASDPSRHRDRFSAGYLVGLGARLVREAGGLVRAADRQRNRVATLALDTEVRFRSTDEGAAFAEELAAAVTALVSRYHDEEADPHRTHRLVVAAHPVPAPGGAGHEHSEGQARGAY